MRATTASEFRKNLARELDRVNEDHEPLIIVRTGGKPAAVLVPLEEFGSWQETNHLLSSPENARRLRESIQQAEEGRTVEVPWPE